MSLKSADRPLSPHIQIWKWTLTMAMSILHRATGIALSIGLLVIVWWLFAMASGPSAYECFLNVMTSPVGKLALFGWTFALYLHMCLGIRHLLMDAGYLISIPQATKAGIVIFTSAIVLTISTWACLLVNI